MIQDKNPQDETADKVTHSCGATSSHCHDYSQIPMRAMDRLAGRFELGEKKHGRDNWRKGLGDVRYAVERLNHAIRHAKILQDKLEGRIPWDKDDDAAALTWAGVFAIEAVYALHPELQFD